MTKQEILDYFALIDFAYNESGRLESLSRMLDELLKEQERTINELQNAYGYLQRQFFEAQDKLLKEQEPVKPITASDEMGCQWFYVCPNCKISIDYKDNFCRHCGKAMKWDDSD